MCLGECLYIPLIINYRNRQDEKKEHAFVVM